MVVVGVCVVVVVNVAVDDDVAAADMAGAVFVCGFNADVGGTGTLLCRLCC